MESLEERIEKNMLTRDLSVDASALILEEPTAYLELATVSAEFFLGDLHARVVDLQVATIDCFGKAFFVREGAEGDSGKIQLPILPRFDCDDVNIAECCKSRFDCNDVQSMSNDVQPIQLELWIKRLGDGCAQRHKVTYGPRNLLFLEAPLFLDESPADFLIVTVHQLVLDPHSSDPIEDLCLVDGLGDSALLVFPAQENRCFILSRSPIGMRNDVKHCVDAIW